MPRKSKPAKSRSRKAKSRAKPVRSRSPSIARKRPVPDISDISDIYTEIKTALAPKIQDPDRFMDIRGNMRKLETFLKQDFKYPDEAERFLYLLVKALLGYKNICCDIWDIFEDTKGFLLKGIIRELKRANIFKNYIFTLKVPDTYKNNVIRAITEYFASEILTSEIPIEDDDALNTVFEHLKARDMEK